MSGRSERMHRGRGGVVTQDICEHTLQNAFTVSAWTVNKQQHLFVGQAGQAVTGELLQEALHVLIAVRTLGQELSEKWTYRGRTWCNLRRVW